jgi:hypothetical protein
LTHSVAFVGGKSIIKNPEKEKHQENTQNFYLFLDEFFFIGVFFFFFSFSFFKAENENFISLFFS